MKMNPVVHFELPADNRDRMTEFYTKAFGWNAEKMGPEMGNYVTVETGESDMKTGRPKKPGYINGGLYVRTSDMPSQYPSIVISVDNIEDAMKMVEAAGGKVIGKPMEIPEVGKYVSFYDTEGNRNSLMQPSGM